MQHNIQWPREGDKLVYITLYKTEIGVIQQVLDIIFVPCEKVIHRNDIMTFRKETLAKM